MEHGVLVVRDIYLLLEASLCHLEDLCGHIFRVDFAQIYAFDTRANISYEPKFSATFWVSIPGDLGGLFNLRSCAVHVGFGD